MEKTPWLPIPNGAGATIVPCPSICDPVLGADGKMYKNECEAKRANTVAIANATDHSICYDAGTGIMKWLQENILWIIGATILAFVLIRR